MAAAWPIGQSLSQRRNVRWTTLLPIIRQMEIQLSVVELSLKRIASHQQKRVTLGYLLSTDITPLQHYYEPL